MIAPCNCPCCQRHNKEMNFIHNYSGCSNQVFTQEAGLICDKTLRIAELESDLQKAKTILGELKENLSWSGSGLRQFELRFRESSPIEGMIEDLIGEGDE